MKAPKNKTIDIPLEEGKVYLDRCVTLDSAAALPEILDKTICGDLFRVLPLLPGGFGSQRFDAEGSASKTKAKGGFRTNNHHLPPS